MSKDGVQEDLAKAVTDFVNKRLDCAFAPMQNDPKSKFVEYGDSSNALLNEIKALLPEEQHALVCDLETAVSGMWSEMVDAAYRQGWKDGATLKEQLKEGLLC